MDGIGGEIENRVAGNDGNRLKGQGLKTETASSADYGSAERDEKFAESLQETGANETQIRGRPAAARIEGKHPGTAVTMGKGAANARKTRPGISRPAQSAPRAVPAAKHCPW
jgi:hypothetical protein